MLLRLVLQVYTTASIFRSCCFSSLPNLYISLSAQRSVYCCFPGKLKNDVSLPFTWTGLFCLEQRQLRMAFLVIYSQVLTFQFINFFPELLAGCSPRCCQCGWYHLACRRGAEGLGRKYLLGQKGIARNAFVTWLQEDQIALSPRGWFVSLSEKKTREMKGRLTWIKRGSI